MIYGDYLDGTSWQSVLEDCQALVNEINAAGSNAAMIHRPDLGIYGNNHMMMQDKNNLQVADLILNWIDANVRNR
jgi:hypothetical protein